MPLASVNSAVYVVPWKPGNLDRLKDAAATNASTRSAMTPNRRIWVSE
jgi:hypothetical protein